MSAKDIITEIGAWCGYATGIVVKTANSLPITQYLSLSLPIAVSQISVFIASNPYVAVIERLSPLDSMLLPLKAFLVCTAPFVFPYILQTGGAVLTFTFAKNLFTEFSKENNTLQEWSDCGAKIGGKIGEHVESVIEPIIERLINDCAKIIGHSHTEEDPAQT